MLSVVLIFVFCCFYLHNVNCNLWKRKILAEKYEKFRAQKGPNNYIQTDGVMSTHMRHCFRIEIAHSRCNNKAILVEHAFSYVEAQLPLLTTWSFVRISCYVNLRGSWECWWKYLSKEVHWVQMMMRIILGCWSGVVDSPISIFMLYAQ